MKDELTIAHKNAASACGVMSLALAKRKLSMQALQQAIANLDAAANALRQIKQEPK